METTRQKIRALEDQLGVLEDAGDHSSDKYVELEVQLSALEDQKIQEDLDEILGTDDSTIPSTDAEVRKIMSEYK